MTKGTITIKMKNGKYNQLWYVNSDGYPEHLGKHIFKNLKSADDIQRAAYIFRMAECNTLLETDLILESIVETIEPILKQYNDYSYIFDEETEKWGFYQGNRPELYDLENELKI